MANNCTLLGPEKAKNQSQENSHTQMKDMCKILPETKHRAIWVISLGGDRFLWKLAILSELLDFLCISWHHASHSQLYLGNRLELGDKSAHFGNYRVMIWKTVHLPSPLLYPQCCLTLCSLMDCYDPTSTSWCLNCSLCSLFVINSIATVHLSNKDPWTPLLSQLLQIL